MREKSVEDCILTMNIIHFVICFVLVFATLKVYLSVNTYYSQNVKTCCESIHERIK